MSTPRLFSAAALCLVGLLVPRAALSSVFVPASGDYATAANWSPAVVPGDGNSEPSVIGSGTVQSATYSTSTNYTTSSRLLLGHQSTGNGTLTLNGSAGALTFGGDSYGGANYVGVDGGTGQLNVNAGTLNLTGAGGAGVGGYLLVGANAGTSHGYVTLGGGTLNVGTAVGMGTQTPTIPGWGSGAGIASLTINSGTVNLGTGTNTAADKGFLYLKGTNTGNSGSATVTLNGGTLSLVRFYIGAGTAAKTVNLNGGVLRARADTTDFLNAGATVNVQNGGAIFDTAGFNITVAAPLLGTGGLTKQGAGTLTLAGTNTYTGNTTVKTGSLLVTGTIAGNGLSTNSSRFIIGSGSGTNGSATFAMGSGTSTFGGDGYTYSFDVGENGGTGELLLESGTISIGSGTNTNASMRVGCNNGANGTVTIDGGTLNVPGRILIAANDVNAVGTLTINDGAVNLGYLGGYSYGDPGHGLLWMSSGHGTLNLNGGTLALYSFNGGGSNAVVNFNGGTLRAVASNAVFVNGTFTMVVQGGGAVVDTAGFDITISKVLQHDGTLGATPDGGLTKLSGGTLTLTAANTFTGDTKISGGALRLTNALALQGSTLDYDNYGGALDLSGLAAATLGGLKGGQDLALPANFVLTVGANGTDADYSGALSGTATLVKTGGGTQTLSGANAYTGNTIVNAGSLLVTGSIAGDGSSTTSSRFIIGSGSGSGGSATFDMGSGTATFGGDRFSYSCDVGEAGATGALLLESGTISLGSSTNRDASMRVGCDGAGSGTVTVDGGTLNVPGRILMAANNASAVGTLTINGGAVNLGYLGGYGYGDPGHGLLWFAGNATLNLNGGTLSLYSFARSGGGTSSVNFNGGTLKAVADNGTFDSGTYTMTVKSGGAVVDSDGHNVTINNALQHDGTLGATPDGGLTKLSGGTLTLTAANTFTGDTKISGGALRLTNALALQGSTLDYNNYGGTLDVSGLSGATLGGLKGAQDLTLPSNLALTVGANGTDADYSGVLSGTASLVKTGGGTQVLSGANSITGPVDVQQGSLLIGGSVGLVTVASPATVSAGGGIGLLAVNGDYAQAGVLLAEIGGTVRGSGYDQVAATGSVSLDAGSTIDVKLVNGFLPESGATFDILTSASGSVTDLSTITLNPDGGALAPAQYWTKSIADLGGGVYALELTVGVPEPSSLALVGLGVLGLALGAWRRRRRG